MFRNLPFTARRRGALAIWLFVAVVAAAIPGLLRVELQRDATLAIIPASSAVGETYARYLKLFPGDVGTMVVATGELCTPEKWQAMIELSEELEALSAVDKVSGLPTAEYVVGTRDVVEVEDFIDLRAEHDRELCRLARDYPPYRSLFLTDDLRAMALYVRGRKDLDEVTINTAVDPVVRRHRPRFLDGRQGNLFQAGSTYQNAEINRLTVRSSRLVGLSAIIMLLASWYVTGSLRVGILSVLCGLVGVLCTLGLMGYAGVKVDPMNALVAQVLIPIGAAFTIHAWGYAVSRGPWRWGWLPEAAIRPFGFAVVTTMVGFGATAVSTVPTVRHFGLLGVFGIAVCGAMSVAVTFPTLSGGAVERVSEESGSLPAVLRYALRIPRWNILFVTGGLLIVTCLGLSRLRVEYGPLDYIRPDNQVRIDMERGGQFFNRIAAPMVISADEPGAALEPELWKEIRSFIREMERKYQGLRTSWLYDQVSALSIAFTADQPEPVALPGSRRLIAQYLLFLDPREVESYLDWDRSTMSVVFRVPWETSSGFRAFKQDVLEFGRTKNIDANLTGKVPAFWEIIDRMAIENLQSLAIGLVLVWLLLWALTRAAGVAGIAAFVNAVPVLGSLACFGFLRIPLDLGSSVVSAIALGIVVDDTGHLIVGYERYRGGGHAPRAAAQLMLVDLWKPVLATSVVIVIGFSVMNLAELAPFQTFSRTLSMAVLCAAFGDLFLLPALLVHFDRRGTRGPTARHPLEAEDEGVPRGNGARIDRCGREEALGP